MHHCFLDHLTSNLDVNIVNWLVYWWEMELKFSKVKLEVVVFILVDSLRLCPRLRDNLRETSSTAGCHMCSSGVWWAARCVYGKKQ